MISRRTIFSILLALLVAGSIKAWSLQHVDECSAYLSGTPGAPSSQIIEVGGKPQEIPCDQWWPRQPQSILLWCMLDGVLLVVVGFGLVDDVRRTREIKKAQRERVTLLRPFSRG